MSGHSKWSTIKRKKGILDAKRGQVFTRLSRNITMAAQEGGADMDSNFMLRITVEQAKAANMPSDNIAKAIKKGTGELSEGKMVNVLYEAKVADGISMLIHCQSDNTNRSVTEVRQIVEFKHGGKFSPAGSLSWQFAEVGVIILNPEIYQKSEKFGKEGTYKAINIDELSLELMELSGIADLSVEQDPDTKVNQIQLIVDKVAYAKVNNYLADKAYHVISSEIVWLANERISMSTEQSAKLTALIEELEEYPDVANVWHNGVE